MNGERGSAGAWFDGNDHPKPEDPAFKVGPFATGVTVDFALTARQLLANEGISARVVNIHTIKPLDKEIVLRAAAETGAIVVAEEHNIIGGLGSAVSEVVCERCPVPVLRVGIEDKFGRSGKVPDLLKLYGLTPEAIAAKAKAAVSMKK